MQLPRKQLGMGWFGALVVLALIAFFAILTIKCVPLYLNQMKVASVIKGVAEDPELGDADPAAVRSHLQRRWDIDDIETLTPRDVRIRRTDAGRWLVYDYEARAHLFYNVDVVLHFADEVPLRKVTGG